MSRRRTVLLAVAVPLVAALAFGLYWFQPWKLWVDERVDEALPTVTATAPPATDVAAEPRSIAPAGPVLLRQGRLISHEHDTSGTVGIVRRPDGSQVLTLRDLATSNGPDVEVWLTDAPVVPGERGWYLFDDGRHVSLGDLKGNLGNQVYEIPRSLDLTKYTSVSLWCARFDVSFGAARLR